MNNIISKILPRYIFTNQRIKQIHKEGWEYEIMDFYNYYNNNYSINSYNLRSVRTTKTTFPDQWRITIYYYNQ